MTESRHIHFSRAEFDARLEAVRAGMRARNLDAMLLFAPESHFWLTGYDTFGFCFFQCLVVPLEGEMTLLTRSADLRQAQHTSILDDIRVWRDAADADPAVDLRRLLAERGLRGARLGVEFDTQGLTAHSWRALARRLAGWADVADASDLIPALRVVKSPAEIAYVRRASEIADAAYHAGRQVMAAGADEGAILAAMQGEVFALGGDYAGNEFIIGSGPVSPGVSGALLCRYFSGRRRLESEDQLTIEWAGAYRRYHSALMRTVPVGRATAAHERLHAAAAEALLACEAALTPGRTQAEVFQAHADTLDRAGFGHARLNACGYSLGARFTPCWMDQQMFYEGAPLVIGENMVFFLHMILMDQETGAAMCLGRTSLVDASGAVPLSQLPLDLDVV